ncbi:MAG: cell envelope biogenesis protein OmpA [Desulfovibrio sp.]|nr:cell envelope biogenesis protein OmpA [Desulfovibrio sp.]
MKQLAIPVLAVLLACACGCTPTQRGAVAGGAIGAAGGAATSAIAGGDAVTGALVGGAIGTAGGAIVGAQHENDEYDDYYYDRRRRCDYYD